MTNESNLTDKERAVYNLIKAGKITQLQISKHERWLGCHKYEEHLPLPDKQQSTLRAIRQIIRTLRIVHHAPILSDVDGYWIGNNEEAQETLERMERTARSQSASWFETYRALKDTFSVKSVYFDSFEEQGSLFPLDN